MSDPLRSCLNALVRTGVAVFDGVLGGSLTPYSLHLIEGNPGTVPSLPDGGLADEAQR
jgi:predicted ATP-dependent serine protease